MREGVRDGGSEGRRDEERKGGKDGGNPSEAVTS